MSNYGLNFEDIYNNMDARSNISDEEYDLISDRGSVAGSINGDEEFMGLLEANDMEVADVNLEIRLKNQANEEKANLVEENGPQVEHNGDAIEDYDRQNHYDDFLNQPIKKHTKIDISQINSIREIKRLNVKKFDNIKLLLEEKEKMDNELVQIDDGLLVYNGKEYSNAPVYTDENYEIQKTHGDNNQNQSIENSPTKSVEKVEIVKPINLDPNPNVNMTIEEISLKYRKGVESTTEHILNFNKYLTLNLHTLNDNKNNLNASAAFNTPAYEPINEDEIELMTIEDELSKLIRDQSIRAIIQPYINSLNLQPYKLYDYDETISIIQEKVSYFVKVRDKITSTLKSFEELSHNIQSSNNHQLNLNKDNTNIEYDDIFNISYTYNSQLINDSITIIEKEVTNDNLMFTNCSIIYEEAKVEDENIIDIFDIEVKQFKIKSDLANRHDNKMHPKINFNNAMISEDVLIKSEKFEKITNVNYLRDLYKTNSLIKINNFSEKVYYNYEKSIKKSFENICKIEKSYFDIKSNYYEVTFNGNTITNVNDELNDVKMLKLEINKSSLNNITVENDYLLNLSLNDNNISSINANLKNLQYLNVINSKLNDLNNFNAKNLFYINLSNNNLTNMNFLVNFRYLISAELNNNKITDFNYELVSKLTYLTRLSLRNNNIPSVEYFTSISMTTLQLSKNMIKEFSIFHAPLLQNLDLSHNQLKSIQFNYDCRPTNIKFYTFNLISNITHISLSFNHLNNFIDIIKFIKFNQNIEYINIENNPLFDNSIVDLMIFKYLRNLNTYNTNNTPKRPRNNFQTSFTNSNKILKQSYQNLNFYLCKELQRQSISRTMMIQFLNMTSKQFILSNKFYQNIQGIIQFRNSIFACSSALLSLFRHTTFEISNSFSYNKMNQFTKMKHSIRGVVGYWKYKKNKVRKIVEKYKGYQKQIYLIQWAMKFKLLKNRVKLNKKRYIAAMRIQKCFRKFRVQKRYKKFKPKTQEVDDDMMDDSFLKEIEDYNLDDVDKDFDINFNSNLNIMNSINNILNFDDKNIKNSTKITNKADNQKTSTTNDEKDYRMNTQQSNSLKSKSEKLPPLRQVDNNIQNTNNLINIHNSYKLDENSHQLSRKLSESSIHSRNSSFLPEIKNNSIHSKENEGFFKKVDRYPSSMINTARREVESDIEVESIYSRNNIMNTSMHSANSQSTLNINRSQDRGRNANNGQRFEKKFDNIRQDWQFEEGSSVEQAYMMLQKRRFDKKHKNDNDYSKMNADQKLKLFKRLKNNNVPVNVKK